MSLISQFARKTETIEVAGQSLTIRALSLAERDAFRRFSLDNSNDPNKSAAYLSVIGCTEWSEEDLDAVYSEVDPAIVDKISGAILKLSGMMSEDVEDAEKN